MPLRLAGSQHMAGPRAWLLHAPAAAELYQLLQRGGLRLLAFCLAPLLLVVNLDQLAIHVLELAPLWRELMAALRALRAA